MSEVKLTICDRL